MSKPIIGITCGFIENEKYTPRANIGLNYANSIRLAGGIPILFAVPALEFSKGAIEKAVIEYLEIVDGVLLTGGPDFDPEIYNEKKLPTTVKMSKYRQEFDLTITRLALEKQKSIMGVCLGCQVLNVAAGGSLYQDIPHDIPNWKIRHGKKLEEYFTFHKVKINKDSTLFNILGVETLETNSAHHQAIKALGLGFKISAESIEDGIIEAIEKVDGSFALGVQWHPEYFAVKNELHLKLFSALVNSAKEKKSSSL